MSARIFIHGLESSNKGTKSIFFREKFPDMLIPNFTGSLPERMEKLEEVLSNETNIKLVGSSFGGLMAALYTMKNEFRVIQAILLAPAINLIEFAPYKKKKVNVPVRIYHGNNDEVIPLADIETVAKKTFTNLSFNIVNDDHYLHKTSITIDWETLLA